MKEKDLKERSITPVQIKVGVVQVVLIGTMPLVMNKKSMAVRCQLLSPRLSKNKVERETTVRHDPLQEFRSSVYYHKIGGPGQPLLGFPSVAVKKSMAFAALDVPGAKKAQIGRLCWVDGPTAPFFGIPELGISSVILAGMSKAPDERTRAFFKEWVIPVTIKFVVPLLNATSIHDLLAAAGIINGLGDWRQQLGSGSHGQFRIMQDSKEDLAYFDRIVETGGSGPQKAALKNPSFYDEESEFLFRDWERNTSVRGLAGVAAG